jgi:hypothetical protein
MGLARYSAEIARAYLDPAQLASLRVRRLPSGFSGAPVERALGSGPDLDLAPVGQDLVSVKGRYWENQCLWVSLTFLSLDASSSTYGA